MYKYLYNNKLSWDEALSDAERMLRQHKEVIRNLHISIKHFKRMKAEDEPFPGEQIEKILAEDAERQSQVESQ